MAGALCCSRCYSENTAAAAGGKQTLGKREGRSGSTFEEPHTAAGGVGAESLQGCRREGGQKGERVQDAAGCESDWAVCQNKNGIIRTYGQMWLIQLICLQGVGTLFKMLEHQYCAACFKA